MCICVCCVCVWVWLFCCNTSMCFLGEEKMREFRGGVGACEFRGTNVRTYDGRTVHEPMMMMRKSPMLVFLSSFHDDDDMMVMRLQLRWRTVPLLKLFYFFNFCLAILVIVIISFYLISFSFFHFVHSKKLIFSCFLNFHSLILMILNLISHLHKTKKRYLILILLLLF